VDGWIMLNVIKHLPWLTFRGPCSSWWIFTYFVGLEFSHHNGPSNVKYLLGRNCTLLGYYTMSVVKSCIVSASLCVHSQFPNMRFHIVIAVKIFILVDGCYQFGIIFFFCLDDRGSRWVPPNIGTGVPNDMESYPRRWKFRLTNNRVIDTPISN
jgi:hypothetical protein